MTVPSSMLGVLRQEQCMMAAVHGVKSKVATPQEANPNGLLGGRPPRVFVARPGGHGRVSGQDGGGPPADLGARGVGSARAEAPAAVAQPPEPLRPSDADAVAGAEHGALSPGRWGGDVSGAILAGRADQERPPAGV